MKLRLMKTPVRIQPPTSTMIVPKAPMWVLSMRATKMPNSPPHPVEAQRLQRVPKAKPSVSEPSSITSSSERAK